MENEKIILFGKFVHYHDLSLKYANDFTRIQSRYKSSIYSLAETYNGKVLYHFSDSSKVIFDNALNAIQFVENLMAKFSQEPRIPYKMALCKGIVQLSNDGLTGEPAVVAEGLIELCSEGALLICGSTIQGFEEKTSFVGSTFIKGTTESIDIYCLNGSHFYTQNQLELFDKTKSNNTIAVLPFNCMSANQELEYIGHGIAEDIIDRLTKTDGLFVTARSSSFAFKNEQLSLLNLSRKLNCSYIVDGSIRKRGNSYRLAFQLVDCSSGFNLISDAVDSEFDSLYLAEQKISSEIIDYFNLSNEPQKEDKTTDYYIDPVAYDYYLKGKHCSFNFKSESVNNAITYFKKALEIVPGYALAYAGLSTCYSYKALYGSTPFKEGVTIAMQYAEKAIEAAPELHEGYLSKALASYWFANMDIKQFETNINKALKISPANAELRKFNGMVHMFKGELSMSVIELKLAKELDPLSISTVLRLGIAHYLNKQYIEAYNTFLLLVNKDDINDVENRLAWCSILLKQNNKALEHLQKVKKTSPFLNLRLSTYLVVYFNLNDEDNFFKYRTEIVELNEKDISYHYNHAVLNVLLKNHDKTIKHLDEMLNNMVMRFTFPQYDDFWSPIHNHPKFKELIQRTYNIGSNLVKIESETKEYVELDLSTFLFAEAQDNYTSIHWIKDKKLIHKVLRATLLMIQEQLPENLIVRCHRSYIVNSKAALSYHKNNNKATLENTDFDVTIPVSRSKEKEIKELFK